MTTTSMHPHEIEEIEMRFGPRMWDATPGACCAYFQTGACAHTEAWTEDDLDPEEATAWEAEEAEEAARQAARRASSVKVQARRDSTGRIVSTWVEHDEEPF